MASVSTPQYGQRWSVASIIFRHLGHGIGYLRFFVEDLSGFPLARLLGPSFGLPDVAP